MEAPRFTAWALRIAWVLFPFVVGPPLAAALDDASSPVRAVASTALWVAWAVVVVCTLVPRPSTLTTLRVLAPAAVVAAGAAALASHASAAALALSLATAALALSAEVGAVFVNGGAYPNERRFPLRSPAVVLVALGPAAWALVVGGAAGGPLLLAARQWAAGAVCIVVGLPLAAFLARAIHATSRRWAVLVPAGLVLHDPMALQDPVLFARGVIDVLRPAPAGTRSLDLTRAAPGLALELVLREEVELALARPGRGSPPTSTWDRLLFTPARPGALLAAAAVNRIRVG